MKFIAFEFTTEFFLSSLIVFGLTWAILYYTIKSAVKNGMIEAHRFNSLPEEIQRAMMDEDSSFTTEQLELKKRYEKGELTIEEYKTEWDKLKSGGI